MAIVSARFPSESKEEASIPSTSKMETVAMGCACALALTAETACPSNYWNHTCIRRAVILPKTTRWDWEKQTNKGISEQELSDLLRGNGENVHKMISADRLQKEFVTKVEGKLKDCGVTARVATRDELASLAGWADIIIAVGGDGTFLAAAAAIKDNTPVIGINSDPVGSEGHLCIGGKNPPPDLIERIVAGKFKWSYRSRVRVTVLNEKQQPESSCVLATNEVFVGEDETAKVSTYEIAIDDSPMVKQKSSGLIVATGTGSTSWYLGVNRMEEHSVSSIIETMISMGIDVPGNRKQLAQKIANRMNEKIPFEQDHPNFAYTIREPIFNRTFKRMPVKGFARKIHLKSKCSKGYLVLDGATKIAFNSGTEVLLEMKPSDSLRTLTLL